MTMTMMMILVVVVVVVPILWLREVEWKRHANPPFGDVCSFSMGIHTDHHHEWDNVLFVPKVPEPYDVHPDESEPE